MNAQDAIEYLAAAHSNTGGKPPIYGEIAEVIGQMKDYIGAQRSKIDELETRLEARTREVIGEEFISKEWEMQKQLVAVTSERDRLVEDLATANEALAGCNPEVRKQEDEDRGAALLEKLARAQLLIARAVEYGMNGSTIYSAHEATEIGDQMREFAESSMREFLAGRICN